MSVSSLSRIAAAALAAGLTLGSSGIAAASHGGDDGGPGTVARGGCSGTATWKLKAKADDGRIEVEAEIDSNGAGQVWTWQIRHDGYVSFRGSKTTHGASGSFSVERRVVDMSGSDSIGVRATSRATGQTCRGHLTY